MSQIYENRIVVTGSAESVAKIKALIINDKDQVDFSIAAPMPDELQGVLINSNHKQITFNKTNENRLGLLTPSEFLKACAVYRENSRDAGFNITEFNEKFYESDFYDDDVAVEVIIEKTINDIINKGGIRPLGAWHIDYSKIASNAHAAMEAERKQYCIDNHKSDYNWNWAKNNWGAVCNAHHAHTNVSENNAEQMEYYFSTKNGYGDVWFEHLLELIQDIEDADIVYEWGDSSYIGGGTLTRCDDGELMTSEMTEEEAKEFLNIEDEDIEDLEDFVTGYQTP